MLCSRRSSEIGCGTISKENIFRRRTWWFAQGIEEKLHSCVIFQNKKLHLRFSQSLWLAPQFQCLIPTSGVSPECTGARTPSVSHPSLPGFHLPSCLLWITAPPAPPLLHAAPRLTSLTGNSLLKTATASSYFLIFSTHSQIFVEWLNE